MIPHTNFDETKLFANFECKNGTFLDLLQKVRSFLGNIYQSQFESHHVLKIKDPYCPSTWLSNSPPALWQDKL